MDLGQLSSQERQMLRSFGGRSRVPVDQPDAGVKSTLRSLQAKGLIRYYNRSRHEPIWDLTEEGQKLRNLDP